MAPGRVDSAAQWVAAPPDAVYRAFVDPEALVAWLPPEGMTGEITAFDPREGGGYRMVLTYRDGSGRGKSTASSDVVEVRYRRLEPGTLVVQEGDFQSDDPAFAGTMTMTWSLTSVSDGTEVEVRAENVPAGISATDHEAGLRSSLGQLAAYLT